MSLLYPRGFFPSLLPPLPDGALPYLNGLRRNGNAFYFRMGVSTAANWVWMTKEVTVRADGVMYDIRTSTSGPLSTTYITGSQTETLGTLPGARIGETLFGGGFGGNLSVSQDGDDSQLFQLGFGGGPFVYPALPFADPSDNTHVWFQCPVAQMFTPYSDFVGTFDAYALRYFGPDDYVAPQEDDPGQDGYDFGRFAGSINVHIVHPFETISFPLNHFVPTDPGCSGTAAGDLYIEQTSVYP